MIRILLVDDSPLFCAEFRALVNWEKNDMLIAWEARNGRDAILQINRAVPDVVLTDISMPVMNGVDLIEYIRKYYPRVPVIAMSAYDDFDYVRGSLKSGASDYLLKHELDPEHLLGLIRSVTRNHAEPSEEGYAGLLNRREFFVQVLAGWFRDPKALDDRANALNIHFPPEGLLPMLAVLSKPADRSPAAFTEPLTHLMLESLNLPVAVNIPAREDEVLLLLDNGAGSLTPLDLTGSMDAAIGSVERFFSLDLRLLLGERTDLHGLKNQIDALESRLLSANRKEPEDDPEGVNTVRYCGYTQQAITYIRDNYARRISLRDIAGSIGLSESYLSRLFKEETGVNLMSFINRIRLDEAERLLKETDLPIKDIANRVGIIHYNHFFNMFHQYKGCTPSDCRGRR